MASTRITSDTGPFALVPRWVLVALAGKPWAVLLYAVLADRVDRDTAEWKIGRRDLAAQMGCGLSTYKEALAACVAVGCVEYESTQTPNGDQGWNLYRVVRVTPAAIATDPGHDADGGRPPERPGSADGAATLPRTPVDNPSQDEADADASTANDPVLAHKCPVKSCAAAVGSRCLPGGHAARDAKDRHTTRVAAAVTKRWYDHEHERQGTPPLAPSFIAMRGLVDTALKGRHDPNDVYAAIVGLYDEGRPINVQTLDARLTARERARVGRNDGTAGDQDIMWAAAQMRRGDQRQIGEAS